MKNTRIIKILILMGSVVVIGMFMLASNNPVERHIRGTIVQISDQGSEWGIRADLDWRYPFSPRELLISELPDEFERDGLRVECDVLLRDVIGQSTWDTVVDVSNVEELVD